LRNTRVIQLHPTDFDRDYNQKSAQFSQKYQQLQQDKKDLETLRKQKMNAAQGNAGYWILDKLGKAVESLWPF
jgi:hypothetical protein